MIAASSICPHMTFRAKIFCLPSMLGYHPTILTNS